MDNKVSAFSRLKNVLKSEPSSDFIGSGFSPAHITGIFHIQNTDPDPLKCGSRGLGFCLEAGVATIVMVKKTKQQELNVYFNGQLISGETTKTAIFNLIGEQKFEINVLSISDLLPSQGFGLSGAGALSTVIALNSALGLGKTFGELVNAAHIAEIQNHTGLGDVMAQATGGVVFRKQSGGFNFGKVERLNISPPGDQVTICVLGQKLSTKSIITDPKHINNINQIAAKIMVDALNSKSGTDSALFIPDTFLDFVKLSYSFASATGLMDPRVNELIQLIHNSSAGFASMIMLGNSIFAVGDSKKLETICHDFGTVIHCKLSKNGAHLTELSDLKSLKVTKPAKPKE